MLINVFLASMAELRASSNFMSGWSWNIITTIQSAPNSLVGGHTIHTRYQLSLATHITHNMYCVRRDQYTVVINNNKKNNVANIICVLPSCYRSGSKLKFQNSPLPNSPHFLYYPFPRLPPFHMLSIETYTRDAVCNPVMIPIKNGQFK